MIWGVSLKWAFLVPFKPLHNFQPNHWLLQPSNCLSFNLMFTRYCGCLEPVTNMRCAVNYELHLLCRKCWVKFCSWMNIWHRWMNAKLWIQRELLFLWIGIQITVWMWIKTSANINVCKVFNFCTISLVIHNYVDIKAIACSTVKETMLM